MMDERRRARRKRVDLMLNAYQNGFPRLAVADNLSETGIRLRRVLQPSSLQCGPVELEFQLPNDPEIFHVKGDYVHSSQARGYIGIRFLDLTEEQKIKVRRFIEIRRSRLH